MALMDPAIEAAIKWARSLPPDDHEHAWVEVIRGTWEDHYRPVDDVCAVCDDEVKHTAMVQVMR